MDGCERTIRSRQMCKRHYEAWLVERTAAGPCQSDGCESPVLWAGLCRRCYKRAEYERNKQNYVDRAARWAKANPDRRREIARLNARKRQVEQTERVRAIRRLAMRNRHHRMRASGGSGMAGSAWLSMVAAFGGRCAYCGVCAPLQQDHVVPISSGGVHELENILPACEPCNARKRAMSLAEFLQRHRGWLRRRAQEASSG